MKQSFWPIAATLVVVSPPYLASQPNFPAAPPLPAVADAGAPSDQRFFGTYCQIEPVDLCDDVFFGLFDRCVTVDDGRIPIRHAETPEGALVSGQGTFTADGELRGAAVAGEVKNRGVARVYGNVPAAGEGFGWAYLSEDGLELRVEVVGESVTLRKDACGNSPPSVALTSLKGPILEFGRQAGFRGQIVDADDTFPLERLRFESDRDGVLTGSVLFPPGFPEFAVTLFTDRLSAGDHTITLMVTDSGGLTGSATVDVNVINHAPNQVNIVRPTTASDIVRGGVFFLEGKAFDPEDFLLPGDQLLWSTKLGNGDFVDQGRGNSREMSFPLPSELAENVDMPAIIRLTASDSSGNESATEQSVMVRANEGNTPPRVAMLFPSDLEVGAFELLTAGEYSFVATALDSEEAPEELDLHWECQVLSGDAGSCPAFDPVDATATTVTLLPNQVTHYRISFTATDSGGLTDRKSLEIAVLASGQIP